MCGQHYYMLWKVGHINAEGEGAGGDGDVAVEEEDKNPVDGTKD